MCLQVHMHMRDVCGVFEREEVRERESNINLKPCLNSCGAMNVNSAMSTRTRPTQTTKFTRPHCQ